MRRNQESGIGDDVQRSLPNRGRLRPREPEQRRLVDQAAGYPAELEAVVESVDEGLIVCDAGGRVRRMNRRAREIHGYASAEEAWQSLPEFADTFALYDPQGNSIPVEDWPLNRAVRGEVFHDVEVRVRNKRTGTEWTGRCDGTPVRDERGDMVLTVLTLRELKEPADGAAEELVRRARIPQENPDPVLCISADYVLRYSNPAAEELCRGWGYRKGRKVPAVVRKIVSDALAQGAVTQHEVDFDSRTYWLTAAPSVADGYVNIYARDITDYKQAGEARREAERKFRTIFDTTSDGIFLLDLEARRFAMCNQSCLQMLGYTEEEFLNLSIPDLHHPDDLPFVYAQMEEFLRGGKPIRHDIRFKRKDGSIVVTDLSPDLVWLDGRRYVVVALKDVTERKRAEEALQKERDQARQYLRVAGVMIVALDAEGKITLINKKGSEILGYEQEEILGRSWFEVCLPEEIREEVTGVFNRLMAGDVAPVEYYENPILRKDGQQRIVAFHNTVLRDPSSRIVGVLFSGEDITERRRAEEALAASEEKYRSLVQNIPDVTWTTDRQGRTLFISPNVTDVYGYSAEEVCTGDDTWLRNVHPDDRPRMESAFHELFTENKPYDVEYRIRRKDGNWIWLHDRSVWSYEKDGQQYADGVFSDITQRKNMEEELRRHAEHLEELVAARTTELRESETRYRSLYHTIADGIFVMALDGRIADVNDSACAQLGYTRAELIGLPVSAVSAQSDFDLGEIFDRLRATGSLSYETSHRRKDGTFVPVELSVTVVEYRGEPAILGVARDITKRKRAEEALQFTQFAVDHTADAAFWMTEDARLFYVNEAACRALGYSREELLKMTVYDIDPAFTESMWRESWRRLKADKSIILETVHRARDGRVYPVEIRANYLEFGGRAYDCAFARDITERKRVEKALRESEERHRFLVESLNDWIWEVDQNTVYTYVSPQCREMLGYEPEEIIGKTPFDLMPPEEARRVQEVFAPIAGQAKSFRRLENVNRHKDGHLVVLETNGVPVLDAQGKLAGYRGVDRDITERKRAEEALRESEERLRVALDAGRMGTWVWDVATDTVDTDPLHRRLWDLDNADGRVPASAILQRIHPEDRALAFDRESVEHRLTGPSDWEFRVVRRDGSITWLQGAAVPIRDAGGVLRKVVGVNFDITERKRAEEALRESERMLRRSQEVAHLGHWSWDVEANRVTWSDEMYRIFGIEKSEFDGDLDKVINSAVHPEDRAFVFSRMAATVEEGTAQPAEYRVVWPDGSIRRVRTELSDRELDATGRIVRLSGIVQDITDLKHAEEALRESEERYRLLLDRGFDGIFVHENFRIVQLNDRFAEMTGYTRSELLGSTAIDLFTPDSQERIRQYIRSGAGGYFEIELRRRDGRLVQVESFGAPCRFQGRSARIVGLRDVTERKLAAQALREKEYLLTESQRIGHIGTWSVDLATNAATWTSETYRLFGVSPETFVPSAETLLGLLHPDDRGAMQEWIRAAFAGERPAILEFRVVFPDGSTRVLSGRGELIFNGNNEPVRLVGTAQDVTEQKQVEAFLRGLNEQLELQVAQRTEDLRHTVGRLQQLTLELSQAEDRERKRIAGILHDDVQQTLAAAKFHLNLLATESRSAEEAQEIVEQVRHMLRDAIEKSRSLSHELSPVLYQVDLAETLRWLACHMERKHGLTVTVEAHGPVDSSSEPLKAFLYRVTQELLFNVVKHAGVKEARIRVRRLGRCIYLSVVDQGRGFDPQALEETAGFGLLGIRERVQLLGGRMKIKSAPGLGSRFLIEVPDQEASEAPLP